MPIVASVDLRFAAVAIDTHRIRSLVFHGRCQCFELRVLRLGRILGEHPSEHAGVVSGKRTRIRPAAGYPVTRADMALRWIAALRGSAYHPRATAIIERNK